MDFYDAIIKRRSIRKYKDTPVSEELVEKLLKAAMYAPSANNFQSWQFIVVNQRPILEQIVKVHPYSRMLLTAPVAIIICGDENYEKLPGYNAVNCSAATENLMVAAYGFGLGSCWVGLYPREERMSGIRDLFKLPQEILPVSLIAVGYPDEEKQLPERFIPSRIHYNSW